MTSNVVPLRAELPWTVQAEAEAASSAKAEDERFWSVTTIIDNVGSSGGLTGWTANTVAEAALDTGEVWNAMLRRGERKEAIAYLANARFRPRPGAAMSDRAAGSKFHALAERWIFDEARPPCDEPDLVPLLDSFEQWLDVVQPSFEALEMTVYAPQYRYAGTLDGIATVNGMHGVLDYKCTLQHDDERTRKGPWNSVALQLAAYRHAQFVAVWKARRYENFSRRYYLLSPGERAMAVAMPATDHGLVLHVSPDHCDLHVVATGEETFEGFLAAVDATRWLELEGDAVWIDRFDLNTGRD